MSMIAETNSKTMIALLQPKMKGDFISEKKTRIYSVNLKSRYKQTIKIHVLKEEKGWRAIVK